VTTETETKVYTRREAGTLRIRAAMNHVQSALVEIGRARTDLDAVLGFSRDCNRLDKLYQAIKKEWRKLDEGLRTVPPKKNPRLGEIDCDPTVTYGCDGCQP
jgi:hypothetical protein